MDRRVRVIVVPRSGERISRPVIFYSPWYGKPMGEAVMLAMRRFTGAE